MEELNIAELINKYGFPIIAASGMGYFIFFIWRWATEEIDPILSEANRTLIALIDRIRMLDNDMIRLKQKLHVALEIKDIEISEHPVIKKVEPKIEVKRVNTFDEVTK